MANTMTQCDKCKKSVDVSEIKYVPKDKDTMEKICLSCAGFSHAKSNVDTSGYVEIKTEEKKVDTATAPPVEKKPVVPQKINYYCGRCKYKFKRKPTSSFKLNCPYCGKDDKVMKDNTDVNSILHEVSGSNFDESRLF